MIDCTLVTCEHVPELDPDDRLLVDELRDRGLVVSVEVWNNPAVEWHASRLCILRSTWDYHRRHPDFFAWLARIASVSRIRNDPSLVRWNAHKSYLRDLHRRGVRVVPTAWVAHGARQTLAELSQSTGWRDVVLKPARGAAAHQVRLVRHRAEDLAAGQTHLDTLTQSGDVLVQPYLDAVAVYGERALIFFEGHYSHTVVKKPFDTALTVGEARSARVEGANDEIDVAETALRALAVRPLYARIDLLRDDSGNACVSEVELIEPSLYLGAEPSGSRVFADAIERELDAIPAAVSGHI